MPHVTYYTQRMNDACLYCITVSAGFNEFGFNESSRFNESDSELKYFFTSIKLRI